MFHAYTARAALEGAITSRLVPANTSSAIQQRSPAGVSADFQLEISQSLRNVMSGGNNDAVHGCRLVADPVLAIDWSFWTHQSTMHSPLSPLGRKGSHNTWREFASAPTTNGPFAPIKVISDSLEASAFLGKYDDGIVRLTSAENLSVTIALSGTFFLARPPLHPLHL
ncbi:hypothetical protein ERJ75_001813600 [Trypanosoma vivax]|nr:hypothetical protein ERJ75_001813600 [Trypanosoma vivax]